MAIVKNAGPYTLSKTWYVDGTATDVGAVTIGITSADGTAVVAAGTATSNDGSGAYSYVLDDHTQVDELTITWTRADTGADIVDTLEVAGGRLFTEAQARAFDSAALASTSVFTDAAIRAGHDDVADLLEAWTGRSWLPRYRRLVTAGTGTRWLPVTHPADSSGPSGGAGAWEVRQVIAATVSGTAITAANVDASPRTSTVYRTDGLWTVGTVGDPYNVTLHVEYGADRLTDGVARIALLLLRDRLVSSPIADRATSYSDEMGTYRFETPGRAGNVSTIPEVNEWVKTHDYRLPVH